MAKQNFIVCDIPNVFSAGGDFKAESRARMVGIGSLDVDIFDLDMISIAQLMEGDARSDLFEGGQGRGILKRCRRRFGGRFLCSQRVSKRRMLHRYGKEGQKKESH